MPKHWIRFPITLNSVLVRFRVSWAGRSAWNDRSVGIAEAAGSNPVPSTTRTDRTFCWIFLTCSNIGALEERVFIIL